MIEQTSEARFGDRIRQRLAPSLLATLCSLLPPTAAAQSTDPASWSNSVQRGVICEEAASRWSIEQNDSATGWKERGRIIIGYRPDAAPFSFERDGEAKGMIVEMCRKIAADAAFAYRLEAAEPAFAPVTAQGRFAALHRGDIDMLCDSSTLNLERMACFGHTLLTFVSGPSLALRPGDSGIVGDEVVEVGVLEGSSTKLILHLDRTLNALSRRIGASPTDIEPRTFPTYEEGFAALTAGKLPAFFADREIMIKRFYNEDAVEVLDEYFSYEPYTIFTRLDDQDLIFAANHTLARIFSGLEIHSILRKHLAIEGARKLEVSEPLRYLYILQRLPRGAFFSSG